MSVSWFRLLGFMAASVWLAAGCSSEKKIEVGATCIMNSDCTQALVCTEGRCHDACHTSVDCPAGQSCMNTDGVTICQLPDEAVCSQSCGGTLVCASDQHCRTPCQSRTVCTSEQVCVSGVCAAPSDLDVNGQLPQKGPRPVADGGADVQAQDAGAQDADVAVAAADLPSLSGVDAPGVGGSVDAFADVPVTKLPDASADRSSETPDATTGIQVACPNGYHDGGDGTCRLTDVCSAGYHNDGIGACISVGCASGYHDGGDGTCLRTGSCVGGYQDSCRSASSLVGVLGGPIYNPENGHYYYLLETNTWTASEAQAVFLGGHLATVNDGDEESWVYYTFSAYGGVNRTGLWIGINDAAQKGTFVWTSGEPVTYTHWYSTEPNNLYNAEAYGEIWGPPDSRAGYWNDADDMNSSNASGGGIVPAYGVVEVTSCACAPGS
jgi:hypothetical protein